MSEFTDRRAGADRRQSSCELHEYMVADWSKSLKSLDKKIDALWNAIDSIRAFPWKAIAVLLPTILVAGGFIGRVYTKLEVQESQLFVLTNAVRIVQEDRNQISRYLHKMFPDIDMEK